MISKIKKMKLIDYWHLLIIILLYLPSKVLKFINPNIWIISENGNDAKDNGFAFFEYMAKNHPEIKTFYIIEKQSSDYNKLNNYKNIILHNSIKDILYTMACKNYVSSQLGSSFPYSNIFFNLYLLKLFGFKYVFLQHGITLEKVTCFFKKESGIDLFCCAANPEYDYVKDNFGFKDYELAKVGFCRYDNLISKKEEKKSILLMLTWRKELVPFNNKVTNMEKSRFLNSNYYLNIQNILNDEKLISKLEKNNIILYFCLHDNLYMYKELFTTKSKNIIIVDKNSHKKVNSLIRECNYLITDISSVAFDFAYQNKRIQYFHFDYDEMQKSHWGKGYFDFKKDGFGIITYNCKDCIEEIIKSINENFENPEKYNRKKIDFFCFKDDKNCERTLNAINNMNNIKNDYKNKMYEKKLKVFNVTMIIVSLILAMFGFINSLPIPIFIANILLFINNLSYGLLKTNKGIYFSLFNFSVFTFLMAKPIIQTFRGVKWWMNYSLNSQIFSLSCIWITLLFLFIGAVTFELIPKNDTIDKKTSIKYIQKISLILFLIAAFFSFISGTDKIIFMYGKQYVEYYLSYQSNLPSLLNLFGGMSTTLFVIYLCTFPSKNNMIFPTIVYISLSIPDLLIGQRNPIVLSCLFIFSYVLVRDYYNMLENRPKFIDVKERIILLIMIPIAIIGLDLYNYVRVNENINTDNSKFVDFFYTQGISYDVLNIGYSKMDTIKNMNKNYIFGPIYDYFQDSTIAKKIFKLDGLGIGNNITRALKGNNFAHILGFLARKDYLDGHGYGSSYILELYCNYGFIGIIAFSFILGFYLNYLPILIKKKNFFSILALQSTIAIYFIPRAETLSFIIFVFTPHFWASLILVYLIYFIIKRTKGINNEN